MTFEQEHLIAEFDRLRRASEDAVCNQDFEGAAKLRDESLRVANQIARDDEEEALNQYVWKNYQHLMSPLERRSALSNNGVYPPGSPENKKAVRLFAPVDLDELEDALKDGEYALRRRAAQRVLREDATQVVVNRCPRCNRFVRTPRAKQCLRCGHDWH